MTLHCQQYLSELINQSFKNKFLIKFYLLFISIYFTMASSNPFGALLVLLSSVILHFQLIQLSNHLLPSRLPFWRSIKCNVSKQVQIVYVGWFRIKQMQVQKLSFIFSIIQIDMNEQNRNLDHQTTTNPFLTTLAEDSSTIVGRESPKPEAKKSVFDRLEAESKMLHAKKQKEVRKQKRIRQLQQQFEMHRAKKQREMQEKLANIEKNKHHNINSIQQKLRRVSIRHNQMIIRIQDENIKQMQQQYDLRKAYENDNSKRSSKLSHTSHRSSPQSKQGTSKQRQKKVIQQSQIQHKMSQIDHRLEKAKTMYQQRKSQTVNKARNHNLWDLYHVQAKAKEKYEDYLLSNTHKIINKMESAELNKDKIGNQAQKKNKQKHKSYSEKLKKIRTNLNQLQEEQQLKFQSLSKKLEFNYSKDKMSQDQREIVYHQKFLENMQKLEQSKMERANRIIQKHKQISLKNRLFKEKRQSLYRTVTVSPS